MKTEFYLYTKMSDGFEDLIWNGNSLLSYLRHAFELRKRANIVSTILIRGLWQPKHLTAINIHLDFTKKSSTNQGETK